MRAKGSGLPGTRAPVNFHALLFLVVGGALGHADLVVVVTGRGRGGVGNIFLVLNLVLI